MARDDDTARATPRPIGLEDSWHSSQEVSFNLLRDLGSEAPRQWRVEHVHHKTDRFDNTVRYASPPTLEDSLPRPLVRVLHDFLADRAAVPQMLSAPDLVLDLPNVVLGSMLIIMHKAKDGLQRIKVRFKRMVGEIGALILGSETGKPSAELCDHVAVRTILGLITPCLQLTSIDQATALRQPASVQTALALLERNRDEIAFYEQLLKRFVARGPAPQSGAVDGACLSREVPSGAFLN